VGVGADDEEAGAEADCQLYRVLEEKESSVVRKTRKVIRID
jgi:hypothetical protein